MSRSYLRHPIERLCAQSDPEDRLLHGDGQPLPEREASPSRSSTGRSRGQLGGIAAAGLGPAPQAVTAPGRGRLSGQPLPGARFAKPHTPHVGSAAAPHGSTAGPPCAPPSRCAVPEQRSGQSGPERRAARQKVACIEVVEAYVERIKEVNPLINAVVKDRFEEALQEARQVDKLLSEGPADDCLEEKFPLLGVPITVKEAFSLYGMPNTSGLVNRRNVIATSDATVVSRLKQAGAIPLGVTNCSELCMWYESSNRVYGRTNNPYDLQRIVGGSSGGEGCVLAAACSVVGVGSDIGGSIRMPAFFNGVFGHKPTTGVVPNDGQFPNAYGVRTSYLCTGPMCRYAEDLEPVLRVMAGPGVSKLKLNEKVSLEQIKFHCMDHDGGSIFVSPVDKEILQVQKKVVEHLESDLGVRVQHVAIHKMKYSFQIWSAMMSSKDSEGQVCQRGTKIHGPAGGPWEASVAAVGADEVARGVVFSHSPSYRPGTDREAGEPQPQWEGQAGEHGEEPTGGDGGTAGAGWGAPLPLTPHHRPQAPLAHVHALQFCLHSHLQCPGPAGDTVPAGAGQ
ncbi:fatty-acid amide hydrolase 2 isoform X2 [Onychostruthus taczanowskii]|uniref:fatty-acid amide hydrolase 2 isoform X2 n=1 Tax=Onychostruthus taczanowskii TaxID=356909 RepID=UPI001B80D125|nr:fatty-acid amide hydrolase 2 isoform X2 [Onychostruthus taczanowskii]